MIAPDSQALDRYAVSLPDRPACFAERGVAVPFTAPMLAGARLRHLPGQPPEILVPALGGRGTYVIAWAACVSLATPTLHDRQLWARLAGLPRPTPAGVRGAARLVALEGYAGRAAKVAAATAERALAAAREETRKGLAARLRPHLGVAGAWQKLDRIAIAAAEPGLGPGHGVPLAARAASLGWLAKAATAAGAGTTDPVERQVATLVATGARLALEAIPRALQQLRAALDALPAAFAGDPSAPARIEQWAERLDWLLDGWDGLAALCRTADAATRFEALRAVLARLPVPAAEADAWFGPETDPKPGPEPRWDALLAARRNLPPAPRTAPPARLDAVARAERLRTIAA